MSANNSKFQVFKFAAIVCLVCSLVVSVTAIGLRAKQQQNSLDEKRINILRAANLVDSEEKLSTQEIDERYEKITPAVVDFQTGELDTSVDAKTYDMYLAANNPQESKALDDDPASIKRRADKGSVYLLIENNEIKRVILPIQGYGLWSTMYGFTALTLDDTVEISGITFYSHGETPGLGAEITNPNWQKKWEGLEPYDDNGNPEVVVAKNANSERSNEVDAIAGATLTSRGVQSLMNFWLGEQGYGEFIKKLQEGEITAEELKNAKGV